MQSVQQILAKCQTESMPPITLRQIGERAYVEGYGIKPHWPDSMRRGWLAANRAEATAETSAYLVAKGEMI